MVLQCMTMEAHETVQVPKRGEETLSPLKEPERMCARPCFAEPLCREDGNQMCRTCVFSARSATRPEDTKGGRCEREMVSNDWRLGGCRKLV
jgi:hypothetical protein